MNVIYSAIALLICVALNNSLSSFPFKRLVEGSAWKALWFFMCAGDILHMRVTAKRIQRHKKVRPVRRALLFMGHQTDPLEAVPPRHVSPVSSKQPYAQHAAGNDPLSQML